MPDVTLVDIEEVAARLGVSRTTAVYVVRRGDMGPTYILAADTGRHKRLYVESDRVDQLVADDNWRRPRGRKKVVPQKAA